jgi:hypothetical protein
VLVKHINECLHLYLAYSTIDGVGFFSVCMSDVILSAIGAPNTSPPPSLTSPSEKAACVSPCT